MDLKASGGGGVSAMGESGGDWANMSPPDDNADGGLCICSYDEKWFQILIIFYSPSASCSKETQ